MSELDSESKNTVQIVGGSVVIVMSLLSVFVGHMLAYRGARGGNVLILLGAGLALLNLIQSIRNKNKGAFRTISIVISIILLLLAGFLYMVANY